MAYPNHLPNNSTLLLPPHRLHSASSPAPLVLLPPQPSSLSMGQLSAAWRLHSEERPMRLAFSWQQVGSDICHRLEILWGSSLPAVSQHTHFGNCRTRTHNSLLGMGRATWNKKPRPQIIALHCRSLGSPTCRGSYLFFQPPPPPPKTPFIASQVL